MKDDYEKLVAMYKRWGFQSIWIKHPSVGSGKIHRRVFCMPTKKFMEKFPGKKKSWRNGIISTPIVDRGEVSDIFPTRKHELIFVHWNKQGHPFAIHKKQKSKRNSTAMRLITSFLREYETQTIVKAISIGHKVFSSKWFGPHTFYSTTKSKITLAEFIHYPPSELEGLSKMKFFRKSGAPESWLEECIIGMENIRSKYSTVPKDKYPRLTTTLKKAWLDYQTGCDPNDPELNSISITWATYVHNFATINDLDPYWLADIIYDSMNKFSSQKDYVGHMSWVLGKKYYQQRLPKLLRKFHSAGFKDRELNTSWRQITK